MQANVAAHQMRYEVDYRGECEGNPMSGLWWRMVEKIQKKTGLKNDKWIPNPPNKGV